MEYLLKFFVSSVTPSIRPHRKKASLRPKVRTDLQSAKERIASGVWPALACGKEAGRVVLPIIVKMAF